MWSFVVVLAIARVVSAIPGTQRETQFYDVAKSGNFAATLSSYFKYFDKGEDFKFSEEFFKHYPEEKICEFVAVYKPNEERVLQGFYIRAENLSDYEDDFFNAVRPFFDYINSNDLYSFSPLVAQQLAPEYFSSPLKNISYKHYGDVELERPIPLFFLVPKKEVLDAALTDKVLIDEKRFCHTSKVVSHWEDELKPSSNLTEEAKSSDFKEGDRPSDLAEENKPSPEAKSSGFKEDDKPSNLAEKNKPSDLEEARPLDLIDLTPSYFPEDIRYDPFEAKTSDISYEPPYELFMRSDPIFDIFPDPYLRFVPQHYAAF